jgi:mannosyltransferase OCH1-like enzyme
MEENIPITFIWIGEYLPANYACKLSKINYPYRLVLNPPMKHKYERELLQIEKADLARLEYIYDNGGIYADFDN